MITIKTDDNILEINEFFKKNDKSFDLENSIVMSAKDKNEILAAGALSMKGYHVYLDCVAPLGNSPEELSLVLGLMKSLLNLADLRGIKTVYGSNTEMRRLYKLLRFKETENDEYELSLDGYFSTECE